MSSTLEINEIEIVDSSSDVNLSSDKATGELDLVVLSSSLLIDRILLYTRFLEELNQHAAIKVWATSALNSNVENTWKATGVTVEDLPAIRGFREIHNYLRRLNEFVWDFRQRPATRMSLMRHFTNKRQKRYVRALKAPAYLLSAVKAEQAVEDRLEKLLLSYPRSEEASERLSAQRPKVLMTTGPFQFAQPAIVGAARNLGIPSLALIPSWDNLSTKNRMVLKHDGYVVWSEQARRELHRFYPYTREVPVYVVGAPQFDVFFQERFHLTRAAFCADFGLRPDRPIIVYALGSPNLFHEHHGALHLAQRIANGDLGDVQMIVRPHPIYDDAEMAGMFNKYAPRVVLQQTAAAGSGNQSQGMSQIMEWVNTFRHADVVVNLSSTVTIDAAIFDRPVVNLDYDPEPRQPQQEVIKDVNHVWDHFKPIAESGGVWLVNNHEEMVEAVRTYLAHPELHREKRRWIAEYVCGYVDGRCGERLAEAVLDFIHRSAQAQLRNGY